MYCKASAFDRQIFERSQKVWLPTTPPIQLHVLVMGIFEIFIAQLMRAATAVKSAPKGSKGAFGDLMARGRRAIDPSAPGAALPDGRIPLSVHTVTPTLPVPANIPRPSYADTGKPPAWNDSYQLAKTQVRRRGQMLRRCAPRCASYARRAAAVALRRCVGLADEGRVLPRAPSRAPARRTRTACAPRVLWPPRCAMPPAQW